MDIVELLVDADLEYFRPDVRFVSYGLLPLTSIISPRANSIYYSGCDPITLPAYTWLSENYRDGDRIFLFGASLIPY